MVRGSHARKQPRNERGQFAPKREVIDLVSDESNSAEGFVAPDKVNLLVQIKNDYARRQTRGKLHIGESSTLSLAKKGTKGLAESNVRSRKDFEKKLKAVLEFGDSEAFKEIKKGVLLPLGHTEIGDSIDKIRAVFEKCKAQARGMVISEANKTCNRIDELFDSLFSDVKKAVKNKKKMTK